MMRPALLPYAAFLIVLPFPGTVAARLLLLAVCFGLAAWQWWRLPAARAALPGKPALAAWIAVSLASLAYAVDLPYTAGELKNELGYAMMAYFAFFTVAGRREDALQLARAAGLGLAVLGAWGAVSWLRLGGAWDERGGHGGAGIVATYVVTILPLFAWLALEEAMPARRRLAAALCGGALVVAVLAMQRATWPVLALQGAAALALAVRAGRLTWAPRRLAAACAVLGGLALAATLYSQQVRYGDSDDARVQLASDSRLALWPRVVARIAEHPLVGAGFGRAAIRKAHPDLVPADTPALWHAHNLVLNYGLELGLPGVAALLGLFAAFAALFMRAAAGPAAWAGIAGFALVLGVLVRNQFNDFFLRDMSLLYWALVGLFARRAVAGARSAA